MQNARAGHSALQVYGKIQGEKVPYDNIKALMPIPRSYSGYVRCQPSKYLP